MEQTRLLFFGDQTVETLPTLKLLSRQSQSSSLLPIFLRDTAHVLKAQVAQLYAADRERFCSFESILGLAEAHSQSGINDVVVSTVLLCIAQLGSLLHQVENDPTLLESSSSEVYILGLCTGLLPSAAAASAKSGTDLLKLAPEILCIALRLALDTSHRSTDIEQSSESWAIAIGDLIPSKQQSVIDDFHIAHSIPVHKHAYLSAQSDSSATISGPPSVLKQLLSSSEIFSKAPKIQLPITAAYHASHLGKLDADKIIGSSVLLESSLRKNTYVISTSSGKPFLAESIRELLDLALDDILQLPLYWSKTVQAVISEISTAEVAITIFGPTNVGKSLRRLLEKAGIKVAESEKSKLSSEEPRGSSGAIAIIGMSGRFPGSESLKEYWELLENGRDVHKKVPEDRFDLESHCDPSGALKNSTMTPYGCFIDRPGLFDTRFFSMSPREAAQIDPTQRLLMLTTYEALEMAGYGGENGRRIGTYFGQTTDDWRECNASQDIDLYYVPGGMRAFAPGRLNYHFKWEGPSYSVDTACSSSSASVQIATAGLLSRDCDIAIAGGGNLMTGPQMFAGLSRGSFLSPTGSCKTFDDEADGYCRGEGVGVTVLKRLEDAIADHDNIQGVIRGVATNHSAHAISITHPHAPTQQKLYQKVLHEAGVEPDEVGYIEMHGTGTQAGDTSEVNSVMSTFGKDRKASNPLYIGAVKANVGHGEAAAGITSLIKSVLMLRENTIPPHPGIKTRMNQEFPPLAESNLRIADTKTYFKAGPGSDGKRKILLNNFNATGGNTSILIEDPPQISIQGEDPRSHHAIALSAKTLTSLRRNKERLLEYLKAKPDTNLADLSYTTTARRLHHIYRTSFSVSTVQDLVGNLSKDLASSNEPNRTVGQPAVVFAFTGQGSQYSGMGKELFDSCPPFRQNILSYDSICVRQGLPSFLKMITENELDMDAMTPVQIQLGLVSLELGLATLWQSWGLKPDVVIGHSLGEYPALCMAGVLSVTDMLFLVGKRAEMMEKMCTANTHSMLAIQSPAAAVQKVLDSQQLKSCGISCLNAPSSTVVSGSVKDIEQLAAVLGAENVKTTVLKVPYAFHSPQLDPILKEFETVAESVRFIRPAIPVASTLQGEIVNDEGIFTANYLARQARQKVDFVGALQACKTRGLIDNHTLWIEIGPSPVCLGLIRSSLDLSPTRSIPTLKLKEDCWKLIAKGLTTAYNSGAGIVWADYHKSYQNALRLLELPTYAFDLKNYWIQNETVTTSRKSSQPVTNDPLPAFSTTCLQRVEKEKFTQDGASVTFRSDPSEPKLLAAIQGHLVDGFGLCPSSVYSDMAFTAAHYLYTKMEPGKQTPAMDVLHMEVFRPLIVQKDSQNQLVRVSATRAAHSNSVEIHFSSEDGSESHDHARCTVGFGLGNEWKSGWAKTAYLIKTRMDGLVSSASVGVAHRLLGPMVYKLFAALVMYDEKYRGLREVFLDSGLNEAVASVRFQPSAGNGEFTYSPYWIDSIVHLAGFVLNGNVTTAEDTVYISHGWESLRIADSLSEDRPYTSYVRMQPASSGRGVFVGDVYIFDGDDVVAVCSGLKFQEMKKRVLQTLLSGCCKSSAQSSGGSATMASATTKGLAASKSSAKSSDARVAHTPGKRNPVPQQALSTPPDLGLSFREVLDMIAAEAGLEVGDLVDEANFEDLGVDSLLKISITSRIQAKLTIPIPTSIFSTYPTVGELRDYFQSILQDQQPLDSSDDSSNELSVGLETPSEQSESLDTSIPSVGEMDVAEVFISAVAAETGIDVNEIDESTMFSDLGVDSLMSIAVLGVVKDQTGRILPASFFNEHPTAAEVRKALKSTVEPPIFSSSLKIKVKKTTPRYSSHSVFLQGRPTSGLPALFLIADGAGSAASYINLPPFPTGLPVYALESPYLHCPLEYDVSFEAVATMYVDEMRNIQPHGPYLLGGWSLGGIHAYEVARQLLAQGEEIKGIIMIDSPCPKPLPHMPTPTIELMEQTGLFVGIKRAGKPDVPLPLGTKQHLVSCVKALKVYDPIPMSPGHRPGNVFIIWAKNGLFEELGNAVQQVSEQAAEAEKKSAEDPYGKAEESGDGEEKVGLSKDWLKAERTTFGPNGWDRLVGEVECVAIEGDHFSVMNPPRITNTGILMQGAVKKFMQ
ncbi:MAG: hypothetical protein M1819_003530 [Sarea resinae]|nr:MAG: hypothetical protein M1819_003530 [Sarea resinae]